VFFDPHSDKIKLRARAIISEFVKSLVLFADLKIHIEAHQGTSEVSVSDYGLSLRRGIAVEHIIRQMGLPPNATITVDAEGIDRPLVRTPPLTNEPENRNATLFTLSGRQVLPNALQTECLNWLRTHVAAAMLAKPSEPCARRFRVWSVPSSHEPLGRVHLGVAGVSGNHRCHR
jgi:hypothetical protein